MPRRKKPADEAEYPLHYEMDPPPGLKEKERQVIDGVNAAIRKAWTIRTLDKDKRYSVYERQTGSRYVFLPHPEKEGKWQLVEIYYEPEGRSWFAKEANGAWYWDYTTLRDAKQANGIL